MLLRYKAILSLKNFRFATVYNYLFTFLLHIKFFILNIAIYVICSYNTHIDIQQNNHS